MKKTLLATMMVAMTFIACKKEAPQAPQLSLLAEKVSGVYDIKQISIGATSTPAPANYSITLSKVSDKIINMTTVISTTSSTVKDIPLTELENTVSILKTVGSMKIKGTYKSDSLIIINDFPPTDVITYHAKRRL